MKKFIKIVVITFVISIFFIGIKNVQASSYQAILSNTCRIKVSKNYYWINNSKLYKSKSGKSSGKVIAKKVSGSAVTDGKTIYYTSAKYTEYGWEPKGTTTIYKINALSNKKNKVAKIKKIINVVGLDKNKLYYTFLNEKIYSMALKDKKIKVIKKTKNSMNLPWGTGKYIVLSEQKYNSKTEKYYHPLKVYNVRTKKTKTITSEATDYVVEGKYVYFFTRTEKPAEGYNYTENLYGVVYKYNVKTGKKVAITNKFKQMNFGEKIVTPTHITYDYWDEKKNAEEKREIWY